MHAFLLLHDLPRFVSPLVESAEKPLLLLKPNRPRTHSLSTSLGHPPTFRLACPLWTGITQPAVYKGKSSEDTVFQLDTGSNKNFFIVSLWCGGTSHRFTTTGTRWRSTSQQTSCCSSPLWTGITYLPSLRVRKIQTELEPGYLHPTSHFFMNNTNTTHNTQQQEQEQPLKSNQTQNHKGNEPSIDVGWNELGPVEHWKRALMHVFTYYDLWGKVEAPTNNLDFLY